MTELSDILLREALTELCNWEALEIIWQRNEQDDQGTVYIPYVMNDAVECYLELTNVRLLGEWNPEQQDQVTFELIEKDDEKENEKEDRRGLIFHQGDNNVVSIWFEKALRHLNCYQYHQIGHMWRKKAGEEHIRRLVHLICVMHDKWNFLGKEACNSLEEQLYLLAEFAPLRYWTPINESILPWYGDSLEGIQTFLALLKEAGDEKLYREVLGYRRAFEQEKVRERLLVRVAKKLAEPEHYKVYECLLRKVEEASCLWPKRTYKKEDQEKIDRIRKKAEKEMEVRGYQGVYPRFIKKYGSEKETEEVLFVEEQPFTVMESEEYEFEIMELQLKSKPGLFGTSKVTVTLKSTGGSFEDEEME